MTAAARENDRMLQGRFGEASWKVALEPERRTTVYRQEHSGIYYSKRSRLIPVNG